MSETVASALTRFEGLYPLIGNTPLLVVRYRYAGEERTLYAKAEQLNLTGSIKDRMALYVLERAYKRGILGPGETIVEATSGNTGIAFAAVGRAIGHPVVIYMPDWLSEERKALIRSFGAEIHLVSAEDGGFLGSIDRAREFVDHNGGFLPSQFENDDNVEAHARHTAVELWHQLSHEHVCLDAFVAGVGTGGTVMGVARYFERRDHGARVVGVEPASSPTLSTGVKLGTHRIQGISDEFVPPIVDRSRLSDIVAVDDGDAIIMAQRLAAQLGIGVGISSGANFLGAIRMQLRLGPDAAVATVFPDSNKKYLSTDLLREEPVEERYMAPKVELLGVRAVGRVCGMCADAVPRGW
jgi:cysteine synthase A